MDFAADLFPPGLGSGNRKNASAGGGWGRSVPFEDGDPRRSRTGGSDGHDSIGSLPDTETRLLVLKNHFPVAMKLLSLTMEDCQVGHRCDNLTGDAWSGGTTCEDVIGPSPYVVTNHGWTDDPYSVA